MDPYTRVAVNRPILSNKFPVPPPYIPPSYARNARIHQRLVLGNITNIQPPQTLRPVNLSQEILDDVEWVGDSVNHAQHPTGNFNGHYEEYPNTYDFTQESPLKYAAERMDSGNHGNQNIAIGSHTCTVQFNDHDDELPGPNNLYEENRSSVAAQKVKKLQDFWLWFIYRTKKPIDPTKGSNGSKGRNSRLTYFSHEVKGTRSFDLAETSLVVFKQKLFKLADDIDIEEDSDGISSILEGADGIEGITIQIYIPDLTPQNEPGIIVTMEDPSKQALQEEKKLSKSQAKLVAQTVKNTGNEPSNSELAITIPDDPTDVQFAFLMKEYGTGSNNSKEGYRVHNSTNNCKVMQLNFKHLYLWAQELAKGTKGVTIHNPPDLEGFKWEDIRRPLETTTPMRSSKRVKSEDSQSISPYSELQGYHDIRIN
ncbi:hypothetical protein DFH28DRAFT_1138898 [Melampsora americana]|nr:hypothetical protein DFH28DRAFT_1138898 [Melampsora americana]